MPLTVRPAKVSQDRRYFLEMTAEGNHDPFRSGGAKNSCGTPASVAAARRANFANNIFPLKSGGTLRKMRVPVVFAEG
jgi:hypothetical protein